MESLPSIFCNGYPMNIEENETVGGAYKDIDGTALHIPVENLRAWKGKES